MLGLAIVWLSSCLAIAAVWWERRHDVSEMGYLEAIFSGSAGAARDVRRDLHRAPRRDGARAVARQLVVVPGARVHRDRVGARATGPYLTPASRSQRTPISWRLQRFERSQGDRTSPPDRGGERRYEPGERLRFGMGPTSTIVLWDTSSTAGSPTARCTSSSRTSSRTTRATTSPRRSPGSGSSPSRAGCSSCSRPGDVADGRGRRGAARASRRGGVPARRGSGPERRQPGVGGRGGLEGAADDARPGSARGLFRGFAETSLGDPSPPTWAYVLLQTHPTLAQRVAMAEAWAARSNSGSPTEVGRRAQVSVYSGPDPPSGGVSRPPFALIAPHCTQFEGVTFTSTVSSPSASPTS